MPKISDERRAERRAQILHAARHCFQRDGVQAATMDDIVRASGLSAGAVYKYFKSKDELALASMTASLAGLQRALTTYLQEPAPEPGELLKALSGLVLSYSAPTGYDSRRLALVNWGEAQRNEAFREALRRFYLGFRDDLARIAQSWQRRGVIADGANAEDVSKAILAFLMGFIAQSAIMDDVTPDALASGLRSLSTGGVGRPALGPSEGGAGDRTRVGRSARSRGQ